MTFKSVFRIIVFPLFFLGLIWLAQPGESRESKINRAYKKGEGFFKQIITDSGLLADTVNPLFNVWETVNAYRVGYPYGHMPGRKYLLSLRDSAYCICHNVKCRQSYCIETTAQFYHELACLMPEECKEELIAAERIASLQLPDGSWEIGSPDVREQKNYPSVTGFALKMLRNLPDSIYNRSLAVQWLCSKQNSSGHWGMAWEYYGCTAYALWAIVPELKNDSSAHTKAAVDKAIQYMLSSQKADGSWDDAMGTAPARVSPELQTALLLNVLLVLNENEAIESAIDKATDFLLDKQRPDGSWNGGRFPIANLRYVKEEYVFCTAMALQALSQYPRVIVCY